MERSEIELSSDLILANIEDTITTDESSQALDKNRFNSFIIEGQDQESAVRKSKETRFANIVEESLYGKTLYKQNVSFLPFVTLLVINQFIFHRVCVLVFDETNRKMVKIRTTWKLNRKNAEKEVLSLFRVLSDRDARHDLFYQLLKNNITRDGTQEYLFTFPPEFSEAHKKYLNKKYSCIVRGDSTFSSTPSRDTYILTRIIKPGLYETFVSSFDEGSNRRHQFTPFGGIDKDCNIAFSKFEKYQLALQGSTWKEIYPLYNLFSPDFVTDCVKFQDITKSAKTLEEPKGLKSGDIILFEKSWLHFDAGAVLKDQGENRFARFEENSNAVMEIKYFSTWKDFVGSDDQTYVLRMFSLVPFDSPENILNRASSGFEYAKKHLHFSRMYHKTPAEYIIYGPPERKESPREASALNRFLRFVCNKLVQEDEDPEIRYQMLWWIVKVGGILLRGLLCGPLLMQIKREFFALFRPISYREYSYCFINTRLLKCNFLCYSIKLTFNSFKSVFKPLEESESL